MKIGELGTASNTTPETIRYYERIGLLPAPSRTSGNYRHYGPAHLQRLNFVRHARALGFEMGEVRSLLEMADEPHAECGEVDRIASAHLRNVEGKIARLETLRDELVRIVGTCRGGRVDACRVLGALNDHSQCAADHASDGSRKADVAVRPRSAASSARCRKRS